MSTKIKIRYIKTLDLDLVERGIEIWVFRLTAQIAFKTGGGWTEPSRAIVDTGAPVTVIPPAIWKGITKNILGEHQISGIVPGGKVILPVKVADVECILLDESRVSFPMKIKAYLSLDHRVPLIIGFEHLLSKVCLHSDGKRKRAYIEL